MTIQSLAIVYALVMSNASCHALRPTASELPLQISLTSRSTIQPESVNAALVSNSWFAVPTSALLELGKCSGSTSTSVALAIRRIAQVEPLGIALIEVEGNPLPSPQTTDAADVFNQAEEPLLGGIASIQGADGRVTAVLDTTAYGRVLAIDTQGKHWTLGSAVRNASGSVWGVVVGPRIAGDGNTSALVCSITTLSSASDSRTWESYDSWCDSRMADGSIEIARAILGCAQSGDCVDLVRRIEPMVDDKSISHVAESIVRQASCALVRAGRADCAARVAGAIPSAQVGWVRWAQLCASDDPFVVGREPLCQQASLEGNLLLGVRYAKSGQNAKALEVAKRAGRASDYDPRPWQFCVAILRPQSCDAISPEWEAAIQEWRRRDRQFAALDVPVKMLLALGCVSEALADYRTNVTPYGEARDARLLGLEVFAASQSLDEGESAYRELGAEKSRDGRVLLAGCRLAIASGSSSRTVQRVDRWVECAGHSPEVFAAAVELLQEVGDLEGATLKAVQGVEEFPTEGSLHVIYAKARARMGQVREAVEYLQEIMKDQGEWVDGWVCLCSLATEAVFPQIALDAGKKCVDLAPLRADAVQACALAEERFGDRQRSRELLERLQSFKQSRETVQQR